MARTRNLAVSGINIVTHPHSPNGYVQLFKKAFALRQTVALRASQHMMIGELRDFSENDPDQKLVGKFYRFLQIDRNAPWFNVARHDVASDDELQTINIPDELRPNTEMFDFVFHPNGHTLYFDARVGQKSLSTGQVCKLLTQLFAHADIVAEFGQVEVTVLPEREQLDRILNMHQLRKLSIDVSRPNPDELGDAQAAVFGRMAALNTRRIKQEYVAEQGESIEPDDDVRQIALVAASNGKVTGHGYGRDGQVITESTVDRPWAMQVPYNPDVTLSSELLVTQTERLPGHVE